MSELKFDPTQRARGTVIRELQKRAETAEAEVERLRQAHAPSDEELLRAYHGDDQHLHLSGGDHVKRLRAVAALTTPEGQK